MRPTIRTKGQALCDIAATLRLQADDLEQLADPDDPSHMPPPPRRPRLSWHESIRAKKISMPAAGGWAAAAILVAELLRVVLEQMGRR